MLVQYERTWTRALLRVKEAATLLSEPRAHDVAANSA